MKLIIAGGRNYKFTPQDIARLDILVEQLGVTEFVSGAASGADKCGEDYARSKGFEPVRFPVTRDDWRELGLSAGPIRNRQMAEYADAVVLFPGGNGTASMFREAGKARIKIFDWRGL